MLIVRWQLRGVAAFLKDTLEGEKGVTFGQTLLFPLTMCSRWWFGNHLWKFASHWQSPFYIVYFSKLFHVYYSFWTSKHPGKAGKVSIVVISLSSMMLSHREVKWLSEGHTAGVSLGSSKPGSASPRNKSFSSPQRQFSNSTCWTLMAAWHFPCTSSSL